MHRHKKAQKHKGFFDGISFLCLFVAIYLSFEAKPL
jgi:hypothetical protein